MLPGSASHIAPRNGTTTKSAAAAAAIIVPDIRSSTCTSRSGPEKTIGAITRR